MFLEEPDEDWGAGWYQFAFQGGRVSFTSSENEPISIEFGIGHYGRWDYGAAPIDT